jgi:hypothetical protein
VHTAATLMKENVSKEHKAEEPKVHPARDTTQTAYWATFPEFSLLTGSNSSTDDFQPWSSSAPTTNFFLDVPVRL